MSDRATWAKLLPVIQAFVNGIPVQKRDYDKRWKDANSMRSLLCSEYRIRPPRIVSGTWEQDYTYSEPGRINGPVATGVLRWTATEQDDPYWPTGHGYSMVGEPRFIPDETGANP